MANDIKGIIIEIGGDSTELDKALKAPEKTARELSKELREVNTSLKFNPDSLEILGQKTIILNQQVAATTDKLRIMQDATAQIQNQVKSGSIGEEQQRAFQREILKTSNQLDNYKRQLSGAESSKKILSDTIKSAAQRARLFQEEQKKVNEELRRSRPAVNEANESLGVLQVAFGNLVAKGIALAITAMKDFLKIGIEYSSSLVEVGNVVETVFGQQGTQILDAWAQSALENIGLSELTAKDYASTLGSIILNTGISTQKNIEMSTSLTEIYHSTLHICTDMLLKSKPKFILSLGANANIFVFCIFFYNFIIKLLIAILNGFISFFPHGQFAR